MKIHLLANTVNSFAVRGRHFRLFSAVTENLQITIYDTQGSALYTGEAKTGVGLDFSDKSEFPHPFAKIEFLSDTEQTIDIWASNIQAHDDRLNGNFDINAALSVAQTAPRFAENVPLQIISEASEVLPFLSSRKKALVQVSDAVRVLDANGVEVSGSFVWESRAALTLYPQSAGVEVRILQEFD